jgi:hypothetical protein
MSVTVKATYKLTGWNANQLKLRIPAILTAYGTVIDRQFKEEIRRVQFPWPNETRRYGRLKNITSLRSRRRILGQQGGKPYVVVGSPRNIVDSGDFLKSQERIRSTSPTELRFRWNAPYASSILNGFEGGSGAVYKGRNWIKPALEAVPLDQFFADQWKALARRKL